MKRFITLIVLVGILVFTVSCEEKETALKEDQCYVYYINKEGNEIDREVYTLVVSKEKISNTISEMLVALSRAGENFKAQHAINSTCKVLQFQINGRQLVLDFNVSYLSMEAVEEVMHRAAIVKTLTQIEGIDEVQFNVDGQPLTINKKAVGFMKGEDFINDINENGVMKTTTINLYFANKAGDALVEVPAEITYDSTMPISRLMIEELLKGPEAVSNLKKEGLQRTLPNTVKCNSLTIRDNICYVDFNKAFENFLPGLKSEVIIYSVINLLVELPNVNKVQFTVEGEFIELIGDTLAMDVPFERNLNIIEHQEEAKGQ